MAVTAAYPPWVLLEHYCTCEAEGSSSSSIADTNTVARGHTTNGHPINVSLCLAAPPEGSRVCVQLPASVQLLPNAAVLAAHGDSVVVQVRIKDQRTHSILTDHFIYSAGDAASEPPRPPSLWLLAPHCMAYEQEEARHRCPYLDDKSTGLLLRGDDGEGDFVVAELKTMQYAMGSDGQMRPEVELHMLRSSHSGEWRIVERPVISRYANGERVDDVGSSWRNDTVIAIGDRLLCWVDMERGLLFSDDVFDESPSLRYVPFPDAPYLGRSACRNVCAAANGSTIKFVNIFPRCCCGAAGKPGCRASHHAYTVHTWTLRMDDMTWTMDGHLDATQLWALDGYNGLPRIELENPVISMDEPDTICFEVCEKNHENHGDKTKWRVMVNMKSKTLRSVFRYPEAWWCRYHPLPSRVSKYLNSKPSSNQAPAGPAAQAEAVQNLTNTRIMQAPASPESAILTALQEIPGLDRDDMLKAYRILVHDDSRRRFRGLMGLPMDLRKECVLMEIKASEACVLCSACSADLQLIE